MGEAARKRERTAAAAAALLLAYVTSALLYIGPTGIAERVHIVGIT